MGARKAEAGGSALDKEANVEAREYISDMARCMSAADLVICRSGASTLSELEALGKASILIPSPNVAENHQYHNAMALVKNGAARLIEEKELDDEKLFSLFEEMTANRAELEEIGNNARAMAVDDAKSKIAEIVVELAADKKE